MTKQRYLVIGLAALCLNACITEEDEPRSCTLMGCMDQLTLTAVDWNMGTPVNTFKGNVTMGSTVVAFDCSPEQTRGPKYSCDDNNVIIEATPTSSVTVKITSSGEPTEEVITLTPTTFMPNGPSCGPTCTQASATMKVATACTLLICGDGVTLTLVDAAQQPITEFSGTVTMGDVPIAITCDATTKMGLNYTCFSNILEITGTPKNTITIDLSAGNKKLQGMVTLAPTTTQPNGPGCSPVCERAEKTIVLK